MNFEAIIKKLRYLNNYNNVRSTKKTKNQIKNKVKKNNLFKVDKG